MDDRSDPIRSNDEEHEAVRDDLAAYALGTLEPAAVARIEAHLRTCSDCAAALRDYAAVLTMLPLALPAERPPAEAWDRLLARTRGAGGPRPIVRPWVGVWRRAATLRLALVATLLLVVTGAGVAISEEFGEGPVPYRRAVAMAGTEAAPTAAGLLVYGWDRGELTVSGLPELPSDRSYQLWFVAPGDPWVGVGVFGVDAGGSAAVPIEMPANAASFHTCEVTEEPAGGSSYPSGAHVLHGEWE